MRSEPVRSGVVPFVLEAHGDVVAGEGPQFLDETIAIFCGPLTSEKVYDGGASGEELGAISPATVFRIGERDTDGVAAVPCVLCEADFLDGSLRCEGREWRTGLHMFD